MCMSKPDIPEYKPPPPPPEGQEFKMPELNKLRRRGTGNTAPIAGGTLLTGPSGVQNNQLTTSSGGSLLGG